MTKAQYLKLMRTATSKPERIAIKQAYETYLKNSANANPPRSA